MDETEAGEAAAAPTEAQIAWSLAGDLPPVEEYQPSRRAGMIVTGAVTAAALTVLASTAVVIYQRSHIQGANGPMPSAAASPSATPATAAATPPPVTAIERPPVTITAAAPPAPAPTNAPSQDQLYLQDLSNHGFTITAQRANEAITLGRTVCFDFDKGMTVEQVVADTWGSSPSVSRVIDPIYIASAHYCPQYLPLFDNY